MFIASGSFYQSQFVVRNGKKSPNQETGLVNSKNAGLPSNGDALSNAVAQFFFSFYKQNNWTTVFDRASPLNSFGFSNDGPLNSGLGIQTEVRVCRTTFLPPSKSLLRMQIKTNTQLYACALFQTLVLFYCPSICSHTTFMDHTVNFPTLCLPLYLEQHLDPVIMDFGFLPHHPVATLE